jgi:hypothetical protein
MLTNIKQYLIAKFTLKATAFIPTTIENNNN